VQFLQQLLPLMQDVLLLAGYRSTPVLLLLLLWLLQELPCLSQCC
jgi:hypothetical protein